MPYIAAGHPYYLSFPNIQRTCIAPSWRDSVADSQPVFLASFSLSCDWECKGKQKFLPDKQRRKFLFSMRLACGEQHSVSAIRGAKVRTYFDFQTSFLTFVRKANLNFEGLNPVDSWRGAKVRGFLQKPRRGRNFFFDSSGAPKPFVLGVQKYKRFFRKQAG